MLAQVQRISKNNQKWRCNSYVVYCNQVTKDEATERMVVEKINQVFLEMWGCLQEAITISMEVIIPAEWDERVRKPEILPKTDKMYILDGKKTC